MYSPYMEAPRAAYPPIYDEPEATKQEVLDVVFGRSLRDGLGRDFDDLIGDTPMQLWAERLAYNTEAERDLMAFRGRHRRDVPASVRPELAGLAGAGGKPG